MPTIDEVLQHEEGQGPEQFGAPETEIVNSGSIFDFFTKPPGEGEVEDYMNHPLNFNNSKGTARIIRGVSGPLGSLNWWIIDVIFGLLEFWKPKKPIDITASPGYPETESGPSE